MFPEPSDDEIPPAVRELMERGSDELIADLLDIGVHIEARVIAGHEGDTPDAPHVGLLMTGFVKDVAFSDRVLHPQAVSDAELVEDIAEATVEDEYERIRSGLVWGGEDG